MQITPDSPNRHPAERYIAAGGQKRADEFQGRLHRPSRNEQLWNEVLIALETASDLVHGWHQALVHQLERIDSFHESLLGKGARDDGISANNCVMKSFQVRHSSALAKVHTWSLRHVNRKRRAKSTAMSSELEWESKNSEYLMTLRLLGLLGLRILVTAANTTLVKRVPDAALTSP